MKTATRPRMPDATLPRSSGMARQATLLRHLQTELSATRHDLAQTQAQVATLQAQVSGAFSANDSGVLDLPASRVVRVTARVREARAGSLMLVDEP